MIKAIIFDFGNVIYGLDNNIFLENISPSSTKSVPELHEIIYRKSGLPKQYETGHITSDQFFKRTSELCNLKMKKSDFRKAFTDIFTPIRETLDLIRRLKSSYKIGLLSNTNEWDFEDAIKTCEVFDHFDAVTLSFIVKEMKPGKRIYRDALDQLNIGPDECVYIDDVKEYADAAAHMGVRGIHYKSHRALIESLGKLHIIL